MALYIYKKKGSIPQEDIMILPVYMPSNRESKTPRRNTWIHWQLQTTSPLSDMEISNRHKIIKDIFELNNTINQLEIMDIYRLCDTALAENTFFSKYHGVFTKIAYILGHKIHINKINRNHTMSVLWWQRNQIRNQ